MDSSPTTIYNLPDDILIDIFSYFNHQNILNAIEVCQRWANIIKSTNSLKCRFKSTILLRKSSYLINRFYPAELNDNITLDMTAPCENIHQEITDLLERSSKFIKVLTLKTFFMKNVFKVLKMTPNLEKLVLINLRRDKTEEMLELTKLKHLELINALKIGQFITTVSSIKTLKIMGILSISCKKKRLDIRYEEDLEKDGFSAAISTFLGRCVNLKELSISNVQKPNITLDCSQFSFNLESFVLEYIVMPKQNLLEFLVSQKSSLKSFSMMICEPQPEVMDLVLFNMHLVELEIDTAMLPKNFDVKEKFSTIKKLCFKSYKVQEYLRQIEYNKVHHDAIDERCEFDNRMIDFNFVKNKTRVFKLQDDRDYYIAPWNEITWDIQKEGNHPLSSMLIMRILSACPDLELAVFQHFYCSQFLDQLNTSCKNLKELRLYEVPKEISEDLLFEDLETLEIDHMVPENDEEVRKRLITLGNKCPKLKTLKIHDFNDDYRRRFRELAIGIKTLEELHVGSCYQFLSSLQDDIKDVKDNGSNLKHFSCIAYFCECKYFYSITGMEVHGVQLTFHGLYRKVFTSIYHDRQLGSMRRRIGGKISKIREIGWRILNDEQTC
ncbi:unnamed protein product [Chironomus riparius]|uniref:F-box domain-containing protein n=1 Tax=Chironomus riparius TaxID=315576 RepID=A0A9N9S6B3_9DIPT|nr:unnamed protein product [Chironomus riparius]